jgi:drug/metabolite transporter (DMT)-like permease
MNISHAGEIAALLTAVSWTVGAMLFEQTTRRAGTFVVNLVKVTLALAFLSILLWFVEGQPFPLTVPAQALPWLVLSGLIGFVVGDLFLFQAYTTVGARVSMLVYALSPAFTAVGGAIFMGEHLRPLGIAGMVLTLAGIMLVALRKKDGEKGAASQRFLGVFFAFIASVCQASGYLLSKKAMLFCDPLAAAYTRLAIAIPGFAIVLLAAREGRRLVSSVRDGFIAPRLLTASFFGPFVGVGLSMFALKNGNAGIVSTIMAMPPVFLIVPAMLVFKEKVTLRDVIGAMVAVCGVALFFV